MPRAGGIIPAQEGTAMKYRQALIRIAQVISTALLVYIGIAL